MTRLIGLQPSLDAAAGLSDPLVRVAAMRSSLEAVAELRDGLAAVGGLTAILQRPLLLVFAGLLALLAWGPVTLLAVRLAIISARASEART